MYDASVAPHAEEDNALAMEPVEEVKSLRNTHTNLMDIALLANEERVLDNVAGKAIEIDTTLDIGTAREFGLYVFRSPNGDERTKISIYNHRHGKTNDSLQIDTSYSSLRIDLVGKPPENAPFRLSSDGRVRLRIFLDRSLIEVFADNGEYLPEWAFPRKGIDKLFRCSLGSALLLASIHSEKRATVFRFSQSVGRRRSFRWMCGRCALSGRS